MRRRQGRSQSGLSVLGWFKDAGAGSDGAAVAAAAAAAASAGSAAAVAQLLPLQGRAAAASGIYFIIVLLCSPINIQTNGSTHVHCACEGPLYMPVLGLAEAVVLLLHLEGSFFC